MSHYPNLATNRLTYLDSIPAYTPRPFDYLLQETAMDSLKGFFAKGAGGFGPHAVVQTLVLLLLDFGIGWVMAQVNKFPQGIGQAMEEYADEEYGKDTKEYKAIMFLGKIVRALGLVGAVRLFGWVWEQRQNLLGKGVSRVVGAAATGAGAVTGAGTGAAEVAGGGAAGAAGTMSSNEKAVRDMTAMTSGAAGVHALGDVAMSVRDFSAHNEDTQYARQVQEHLGAARLRADQATGRQGAQAREDVADLQKVHQAQLHVENLHQHMQKQIERLVYSDALSSADKNELRELLSDPAWVAIRRTLKDHAAMMAYRGKGGRIGVKGSNNITGPQRLEWEATSVAKQIQGRIGEIVKRAEKRAMGNVPVIHVAPGASYVTDASKARGKKGEIQVDWQELKERLEDILGVIPGGWQNHPAITGAGNRWGSGGKIRPYDPQGVGNLKRFLKTGNPAFMHGTSQSIKEHLLSVASNAVAYIHKAERDAKGASRKRRDSYSFRNSADFAEAQEQFVESLNEGWLEDAKEKYGTKTALGGLALAGLVGAAVLKGKGGKIKAGLKKFTPAGRAAAREVQEKAAEDILKDLRAEVPGGVGVRAMDVAQVHHLDRNPFVQMMDERELAQRMARKANEVNQGEKPGTLGHAKAVWSAFRYQQMERALKKQNLLKRQKEKNPTLVWMPQQGRVTIEDLEKQMPVGLGGAKSSLLNPDQREDLRVALERAAERKSRKSQAQLWEEMRDGASGSSMPKGLPANIGLGGAWERLLANRKKVVIPSVVTPKQDRLPRDPAHLVAGNSPGKPRQRIIATPNPAKTEYHRVVQEPGKIQRLAPGRQVRMVPSKPVRLSELRPTLPPGPRPNTLQQHLHDHLEPLTQKMLREIELQRMKEGVPRLSPQQMDELEAKVRHLVRSRLESQYKREPMASLQSIMRKFDKEELRRQLLEHAEKPEVRQRVIQRKQEIAQWIAANPKASAFPTEVQTRLAEQQAKKEEVANWLRSRSAERKQARVRGLKPNKRWRQENVRQKQREFYGKVLLGKKSSRQELDRIDELLADVKDLDVRKELESRLLMGDDNVARELAGMPVETGAFRRASEEAKKELERQEQLGSAQLKQQFGNLTGQADQEMSRGLRAVRRDRDKAIRLRNEKRDEKDFDQFFRDTFKQTDPMKPARSPRIRRRGSRVTIEEEGSVFAEGEMNKKVKLKPHQLRVAQKLDKSGGVLVFHKMGGGKTLTSIGATMRDKEDPDIVVPAALRTNFQGAVAKHTRKYNPLIRSYEQATKDYRAGKGGNADRTLILDEPQLVSTPGTKRGDATQDLSRTYGKRLLLTGTPIRNHPSELARLINIVRGDNKLPTDQRAFERQFMDYKGDIRNEDKLKDLMRGYVDYYVPEQENFPDRTDRTIKVEMSPKQVEVYKYLMGRLRPDQRRKVRQGIPMENRDDHQVNAFFTGTRMMGNSLKKWGDDSATPKISAAVTELMAKLNHDKAHKAVVYSNYLDAGTNTYAAQLAKHKIPYAIFDGSLNDKKRQQVVEDYNNGRIRVVLVSAAGSQGLDLKGTRLVQILEPHWNKAREEQVVGRAIRFGSHDHLKKEDRNVEVQRFLSVLPGGSTAKAERVESKEKVATPGWMEQRFAELTRKLGLDKVMEVGREVYRDVTRTGGSSADEYIQKMADRKEEVNEKFLRLLEEVGSEGIEEHRKHGAKGHKAATQGHKKKAAK